MKTIYPLSQHIISKIAAGEVIERPAYAVKELIENAIDAHADTITIQIEEAGLKKIIITDNGEGMSDADIAECFKPHTTSKLHNNDILIGIQSLGFRGEALSSIAAISTIQIQSRTSDTPHGIQVSIQNGMLQEIVPIGIPVGTTVIAKNLFHNVPARKNFLKSIQTEFRLITQIVSQYAISFPNIRFSLSHNNRRIYDVPKQKLFDRIQSILGQELMEYTLGVNYSGYTNIKGFIAKPQITTQSLQKQLIFVNNRRVYDRKIIQAVKVAYGNLLEPREYPVFVLFLSLPYETVDVNIHPRKEHVQFMNSQIIYEDVQDAVKATLKEHNITFNITLAKNIFSPRKSAMSSHTGNLLHDAVRSWNTPLDIQNTEIIQAHNLYLIIPIQQGLLVLDQHAAHERILYEKLLKTFHQEKEKNQVYTLPEAKIIELSLSDLFVFNEFITKFENLGFGIEHFGNNSIKVIAIPILLKQYDIVKTIQEILDDLSEEKSTDIDKQSQKIITYIACRSAIKAGDIISKDRARNLLEELELTPNNTTCPHGRPTKIEIPLKDLHRMFKRK